MQFKRYIFLLKFAPFIRGRGRVDLDDVFQICLDFSGYRIKIELVNVVCFCRVFNEFCFFVEFKLMWICAGAW